MANWFLIQQDMIKDTKDAIEDTTKKLNRVIDKPGKKAAIHRYTEELNQLHRALKSREAKLKTESLRAENSARDRFNFKYMRGY